MAGRIGNPPRSLAPEMADAGAWRHAERNPGNPAIVAQSRPRGQSCVVREAVLELTLREHVRVRATDPPQPSAATGGRRGTATVGLGGSVNRSSRGRASATALTGDGTTRSAEGGTAPTHAQRRCVAARGVGDGARESRVVSAWCSATDATVLVSGLARSDPSAAAVVARGRSSATASSDCAPHPAASAANNSAAIARRLRRSDGTVSTRCTTERQVSTLDFQNSAGPSAEPSSPRVIQSSRAVGCGKRGLVAARRMRTYHT